MVKSLKCSSPAIWNDFIRNIDNNKNICNTGIFEFRNYLRDFLISQYNID